MRTGLSPVLLLQPDSWGSHTQRLHSSSPCCTDNTNQVVNFPESVCMCVSVQAVLQKPALPNFKPVNRQHPTLNFSVGCTYKTQARTRQWEVKPTILMSNRFAKLGKDVYWMLWQVGKRNHLLNICLQCQGEDLSECGSEAGLVGDSGWRRCSRPCARTTGNEITWNNRVVVSFQWTGQVKAGFMSRWPVYSEDPVLRV